MVKAVIFDMDGLLLDTEKLLVRFWQEAARDSGFDMTREIALNIRSMHRSFAIPYLKSVLGDDFDYLKIRSRRMELMNEHLAKHGLELKKGAKTLLTYLNENKIPAAVATATDYERAEKYLKETGIFGYFDKIICATMVKVGKPKPDIYIYAASELGLEPSECAALEDSPNGVKSAAAAGCKTIMVPDLTEPDEELSRIIAAKAGSLDEVIGILEKI
ncbi:MAG: HAD family phosphatase [[Eubacterium] saphenum]|nr:HAD family phosphatase [[Eubacterium] saphenum]